jgi:hypothetical protein
MIKLSYAALGRGVAEGRLNSIDLRQSRIHSRIPISPGKGWDGTVSILMNLWGITPELHERLVAGNVDEPYTWTRKTERVGKKWDLLFRTLAGPSGFHPSLAAIAVGGGWPIEDPYEADYGGAYVLSPREVALVSPALEAISDDRFEGRYGAADFTGLYGDPGTEGVEHILDAFHALRDFYRECAHAGDGVLKFLG